MRSKIAMTSASVVVAAFSLVEQRILRRRHELRPDEHTARPVVRHPAIRALEPRADAGRSQRPHDRVGLRPVACDGDRHESLAHREPSVSVSAPPRRNSGAPRSGNGSSMVSKSRGTTVFAKMPRASSLTSRGAARAPRWVSASSLTSLAAASEVKLLALTHLGARAAPRLVKDEARGIFANTVVPRDFDTIELPLPERGAPELRRGGADTDTEGSR